jgi:hypothetical protein
MLTSGCGPHMLQHSKICRPTSLKKSRLAFRHVSSKRTADSGDLRKAPAAPLAAPRNPTGPSASASPTTVGSLALQLSGGSRRTSPSALRRSGWCASSGTCRSRFWCALLGSRSRHALPRPARAPPTPRRTEAVREDTARSASRALPAPESPFPPAC